MCNITENTGTPVKQAFHNLLQRFPAQFLTVGHANRNKASMTYLGAKMHNFWDQGKPRF